MITLRYSTNNDLICQVFEDSELIGRVRIKKNMTCDKYLAAIQGEEEDDCSTKEFDTLHDALHWLEKRRGRSKGS